jgi:hypothetical protein
MELLLIVVAAVRLLITKQTVGMLEVMVAVVLVEMLSVLL